MQTTLLYVGEVSHERSSCGERNQYCEPEVKANVRQKGFILVQHVQNTLSHVLEKSESLIKRQSRRQEATL